MSSKTVALLWECYVDGAFDPKDQGTRRVNCSEDEGGYWVEYWNGSAWEMLTNSFSTRSQAVAEAACR